MTRGIGRPVAMLGDLGHSAPLPRNWKNENLSTGPPYANLGSGKRFQGSGMRTINSAPRKIPR